MNLEDLALLNGHINFAVECARFLADENPTNEALKRMQLGVELAVGSLEAISAALLTLPLETQRSIAASIVEFYGTRKAVIH